jgi:hypothetical protein
MSLLSRRRQNTTGRVAADLGACKVKHHIHGDVDKRTDVLSERTIWPRTACKTAGSDNVKCRASSLVKD